MSDTNLYLEYVANPNPGDWPEWLESKLLALRSDLAALSQKCTSLENDREYNAGLVAERDAELAELKALDAEGWEGARIMTAENKRLTAELAEMRKATAWVKVTPDMTLEPGAYVGLTSDGWHQPLSGGQHPEDYNAVWVFKLPAEPESEVSND